MVGPTRINHNVDGLLKIDGEVYKAQYDAKSGALILEEVKVGRGTAPPPRAGPGGGEGKTEEAKPGSGEPDVPEDMASLKVAIERVLKQNRANKLQHNQLKGKLTLKSRALTKSQSGSKSINSKKTKTSAMGYNVILLVDNSGSMHHEKIQLANAVAKGLHATLRATDGINVKVLSFTDEMKVRANWTDTQVETMVADGGNADAAACYIAMTRHFNDAPDQNYRNILLVLSDGEPCAGMLGEKLPKLDIWNCDNDSEAKRKIAQFLHGIAKREHIFIAGLGILHNSTQIPNSRQIDKLEDVQRALVTILKGAVEHE